MRVKLLLTIIYHLGFLKDKLTYQGRIEYNFPSRLKLADITPAHKKGDVTDKSNYRHISLLPVISKFSEKLYAAQISIYMENYFSKYFCGFRKGLSRQYYLLHLIGKIMPTENKEK